MKMLGERFILLAAGVMTLVGCQELDIASAPDSRQDAPVRLNVSRLEERVLQVPPAPEPISERQVLEELAAAARTVRELGMRDFQGLLSSFETARTSWDFQWLTAHALNIALHQRGEASDVMLRRLVQAQTSANVVPGFTSGFLGTAECIVGFDDPQSLAALPDKAKDTFAYAPHYAQGCGSDGGVIRFEPMQSSHYHLLYEDPTIDCVDLNTGSFGRGGPSNCTPLEDPAAEPRMLAPHINSQYIRIWRTAGFIVLPGTFSMAYFINVGESPVKVRYKTSGGQWFQWNSMAGNTGWDVSQFVVDVVEVQITHPSTDPPCGPNWEAAFPGGGCPPGGAPWVLDTFGFNP
jgi:hypothetical protein